MAKMLKNLILRTGQGQGYGQGHIERKIFRPLRIRHKKLGFPLQKTILTSFDLQGHGQGHGQGYHRIAREKS